MPWSGSAGSKTFSRTDGTRTGTTTWTQADAAGVDIISSAHDTHDQDLATGINSCLMKDGGNTATSNIPMGGFKFTNLGDAAALTQALTVKQALNQSANYVATVGGTANVITLTTAWTATAYTAGMKVSFIPTATNSGSVTVNVDGLGAKNVYIGGNALTGGELVQSRIVEMTYDGTQFQVDYTAPTAISVGTVMAWPTSTVPSGWLECDGSAVSRSTYAALYSIIGTTYGTGDGSTTFNLPNYKDYFLRGYDASGTDASSRTDRGDGTTGANVGTKQAAATLPHTHTFTTDSGGAHTHDVKYTTDGENATAGPQTYVKSISSGGTSTGTAAAISGGAHTHTGTTDLSSGSNTETRPKNITVKWIILASPSAGLASGVPAAGSFSASPRLCHTGGVAAKVSTDGTDSTPVITEVYIAEVFVPANCTVTGVAVFNGSVASGNIKVGLASSAGAVLATSASTAMSGTDAYQRVAFTSAYSALGPATYYVLLFVDNTTARFNTHTIGNFGAGKQTGQVYATGFTTITPPTTFTTALGPIASLY